MPMSKYVVVDCRLSEKCCTYLINEGYSLIKIPCSEQLDKPISAHPDMMMFIYKDKLFILDKIKHLFDKEIGIKVVDREVNSKEKLIYPEDVSMNCALVGNKLICNRKYVNKEILDYAIKDGCEIIHVNQGYTKCSICVVSDNAIITEDIGISAECQKHGIDVLLLNARAIALNGYDYGFIGGSCGTLGDRKIVFAGNIEMHPEYNRISEFCAKHGKDVVSMSEEPLYDVGSILEL